MTPFFNLILLALASTAIFAFPMNGNKGQNGNQGQGSGVPEDPAVPTSGMSASALIEMTNANAVLTNVVYGDVAVDNRIRNADPCAVLGCMWPTDERALVTVPYKLSKTFRRSDRRTILQALKSFHDVTCIRFVRASRRDANALYIQPLSGCWSYIGRQGGMQDVSLGSGCVVKSVIQHEVLHALGFHHEQSRSDRDDYVEIRYDNIQPGKANNFDKVDTHNLGTPYDYQSVMQYSRFAFSTNYAVLETIVPRTPVDELGGADEMSHNDIARINALYGCNI